MRRHDFDALSFVFGLFFVGVGLVLLGGVTISEGLAVPWVGPIVAICLGLLILVAARPHAGSATVDDLPRDASDT